MPRGPASAADCELVAKLADWNCQASTAQLERWRRFGALPAPIRRGLGRGAGSTSKYPPEAVTCAFWLAQYARPGLPLAAAVIDAWMFGHAPIPERGVRRALTWAVERRAIHPPDPDGVGRHAAVEQRPAVFAAAVLEQEGVEGLGAELASDLVTALFDDSPLGTLVRPYMEGVSHESLIDALRDRELQGRTPVEGTPHPIEMLRSSLALPVDALTGARDVISTAVVTAGALWMPLLVAARELDEAELAQVTCDVRALSLVTGVRGGRPIEAALVVLVLAGQPALVAMIEAAISSATARLDGKTPLEVLSTVAPTLIRMAKS